MMKRIRQQGFGLVEVMVAITLGLLLTAAVLQLFVSNNTTYRTTNSVGVVQDNARFAQDLLSKELRMTGYRGCLSKQNVAITSVLESATTLTYDFSAGLRGYNNLTATLPTELSNHLTGDPTPLANTDLLLIQGPGNIPVPIVANNNAAQLFAAPSAMTLLKDGDIALITDCSKARIFQITGLSAAGPDAAGPDKVNITHVSNNNGAHAYVPGNNTSDWDPNKKSDKFGTNAELMSYQTSTYYLATNSVTGQPALYRKLNGGLATPLLDYVFDLQILYGVDTNSDRQTDSYQTANNVSNWGNVLTLKLQLLLGSEETGIVPKKQSFTFNGATFTATDTRWYMPTTITAVLRNRLN
ncbi:PilW family protein [Pseudaeromonas pectinilytica]